MSPRLSVLVQIDLDGRAVTLVVTGALTTTNHKALTPLVARARNIFPEATITVDLTASRPLEPLAVEMLERNLAHRLPPVPRVLAPHPQHPAGALSRRPTALSASGPRGVEAGRSLSRLFHDPEAGLPATA